MHPYMHKKDACGCITKICEKTICVVAKLIKGHGCMSLSLATHTHAKKKRSVRTKLAHTSTGDF